MRPISRTSGMCTNSFTESLLRRHPLQKANAARTTCWANFSGTIEISIRKVLRSMTVYRQPTAAVPQLTIGQDEVYTTPLLPGFELPLSRLLAEADMIEQAELEDGDVHQAANE